MSTTSVRVTRLLRAEIARVFDAWSDAERMARWFVVDAGWTAKATNNFHVGGKYRIEMHRTDGTVFLAHGEYLEIDPPRRLVFTWSSAVPAIERSVVTIELSPKGSASTELTLVHDLLPDTDEGRAHSIGWEGSLDNLERHLGGQQ